MDWIKKNWLFVMIGVALLAFAYWFFAMRPASEAAKKAKAIRLVENDIRNTPKWLADVQAKATAAGISLDAQIAGDAKWMVENEGSYMS